MRLVVSLLLAVGLTSLAAAPSSRAEDAPVYAVSYIEVAPAGRNAAIALLRQLATASRKDDGNTRFEILERTAPNYQFAIVSSWKDQKSYDAHVTSAHFKEFRDKIKPQLISTIDDRTHTGLEAAMDAGNSPPGAVFVVTHVDVPPPSKDSCIAALKTLATESRKEAGSARFDVFQQASRPNHFTVVEIWKSQAGYDAHIVAPHTKAFRDQLTPMSGALYDERLYHAI
jgi:quinol monooxygenase YgiN